MRNSTSSLPGIRLELIVEKQSVVHDGIYLSMTEFTLVLLIITVLVGLPLAGKLIPPNIVIILVLSVMNLINVFVMVINLWQAIKRDQRFMNPIHLSTIVFLVGVCLLVLFGLVMG